MYTFPIRAMKVIRVGILDFVSFCVCGYNKSVTPDLNTRGFRAFFEISVKLTSPSEQTSYACSLRVKGVISV